jgi:NADPH-dependent F420 reductase
MTEKKPVIAVLGGTGHEGSGLARRFARAGYPVYIGSRDGAKAEAKAKELPGDVRGGDNLAAAQAGEIVILTVPWSAQLATLKSVAAALEGKILVDVTVPLVPPKVSRVQLPPEDSAVVAAQNLLGPGVKVVSAFQNVSAHVLLDDDATVDCDVLVCGDDEAAREAVVQVAKAAGMRAFHAGPLANSVAAEALTSILIFLNRRYKVPGSGIRLTGLPENS